MIIICQAFKNILTTVKQFVNIFTVNRKRAPQTGKSLGGQSSGWLQTTTIYKEESMEILAQLNPTDKEMVELYKGDRLLGVVHLDDFENEPYGFELKDGSPIALTISETFEPREK